MALKVALPATVSGPLTFPIPFHTPVTVLAAGDAQTVEGQIRHRTALVIWAGVDVAGNQIQVGGKIVKQIPSAAVEVVDSRPVQHRRSGVGEGAGAEIHPPASGRRELAGQIPAAAEIEGGAGFDP